MDTCDALIVGGGPAGSTLARCLHAGGLDVVVIDKRTFPRDKICAGWITPAVIQELALDAADYAASRVFQPITGFRTGIIGGPVVHTRYDHPVSYGIRRCEFDQYLLQRSGARLRLGEKVATIVRSGRSWIVNGSLTAPLLIGAGGHACPVARLVGGPAPSPELVVAAQEIEFRLDPLQLNRCAVNASVPELYFSPDLLGYGWCFRKGDFLNIGLGREDNQRLAEHTAAFFNLMKQQGRIPPDVPDKFRGHAYILYSHSTRPLAAEGALLIGDAAGMAYSASGEGIRPAIESALLAADSILDARGNYSEASLRSYANRITTRFGARTLHTARSTTPPSRLQKRIVAFLLGTRWFSRHILVERCLLHTGQVPLTSRQDTSDPGHPGVIRDALSV